MTTETKIDLSKYHNALSRKNQIIRLLWAVTWAIFARPLPRSVGSGWKRTLLRLFGAKIDKTAVVYSTARVYYPANLVMGRYACLASDVDCYNVARITIGDNTTISQGAYLCTASHDITDEDNPLITAPITIESFAWVAADAFVELDPDLQESLISGFSDSELKLITDRLFVDDTVDILEEMPANVVKRILAGTDSKKRDIINEILKYPRQSAGSVMTVEFVRVRPEMTVAEAFEQIRVTGIDKKTIYTLYVTDSRAKLVGIVTVKKLLLSPQDALLRDIMTENVVYGHTYDDKEETARTIDKYGFLALPVVDRENRLVGIVTVDDAMTVIQEENTEDIEKIHAIVPTDKPYLKTGVWELFVHRLPWLLILMISATFTGIILNTYESSLSAIGGSLLIACVPMLMDTGGNAGSQASVTVIRGLALGEIRMRDIFRIQWKELRAAGLLAVCLGAVCFAKLMLIDNLMFGYDYTPVIAAIVSLSLFITVLLAKFVGCSLPLVAKAMHLDPAVVASPFITTVVDALSLIVYCNIAIAFLG